MKAMLLVLAGALGAALLAAMPAPAQDLAMNMAQTADAAYPATAVAQRAGFTGDILIAHGDDVVEAATISRGASAANLVPSPRRWRWASITKQVIATIVMQEVAKGRIVLDSPVATYLPGFRSPGADRITVRQLLRHQSGLPNPSDTPVDARGIAAYYAPGYRGDRNPLTGYCAGPLKGEIGGQWSYNNCDYIVAGALLAHVTGKNWQTLVRERIGRPLGLRSLRAVPQRQKTVQGLEDGKPEAPQDLAAYDASAGLSGTIGDLWAFDRALTTGKLLASGPLAEMWDGQPRLGFIALGQWVFSVPLKGCAGPVRIVERRGAIGGVEVRNFILPDRDSVVIAFSDRAGFDFGEVWQGRGFSHDLLAAGVCR